MTVGTTTYDLRSSWAAGKMGPYFRKAWNGVDFPKVPVQKGRQRLPGKGYVSETVTLYNGEVVTFRRRKPPPPRVRPPKRARSEQHPYTSSLIDSYAPPAEVMYNGQRYNFALDNVADSLVFLREGNGTPVVEEPWTSNDDLALLGDLREQIAGTDFNLGVFLSEINQSLGMIADSANKIYRAMKLTRQGRVVQAARVLLGYGTSRQRVVRRRVGNRLADISIEERHRDSHKKTLSQNWLELQYGWLPLVSDAYDAAIFAADVMEGQMLQKYRVRRKRKGRCGWNAYYYRAPEYHGFIRKQIVAFLSEKSSLGLSGLLDPLSVLWEKTPWSFVVDWFIPIGNYLEAKALSRALTGTFVTTTTKVMYAKGITAIPSTVPWEVPIAGTADSIKCFKITVDRVVSSNLSVPLPSWKPLKQAASWKHCANAVALLTGSKKLLEVNGDLKGPRKSSSITGMALNSRFVE